jgi:multimeric flavodoxin WrbA
MGCIFARATRPIKHGNGTDRPAAPSHEHHTVGNAMKPNDENGKLPPQARPFRVLVISGSQRRQYNCPGVDSKSRMLMMHMAKTLPQHWEIDYEDLGNVYVREKIHPCNACVSTSMALCCWPCNCYSAGDDKEPDLMWNLDLYSRLDLADAWAIIGPVNWYGPTSNLKLMFDRLVCASGGNPREDLIDHKDPEKAMALEHQPEWRELSQNHLEGRTAAFFLYGDQGGDEIGEDGRPRALRHPQYFDPSQEPGDDRNAYAGLVWQTRYSGVEVPDALWRYEGFGMDRKYSDSQAEDMAADAMFMARFDAWVDEFARFVEAKGKMRPNKYRAYGYVPPKHKWADVKLWIRDRSMRVGVPPEGSSPRAQQEAGLNDDVRADPSQGEGERLRNGDGARPPAQPPQ